MKAKAGDLVLIGYTWCLVYRGNDGILHNIILADGYKTRSGGLKGEELEECEIVCHLSNILHDIRASVPPN